MHFEHDDIQVEYCHRIETIQLICISNKLAGFYTQKFSREIFLISPDSGKKDRKNISYGPFLQWEFTERSFSLLCYPKTIFQNLASTDIDTEA